jgi:nucleoside-triphosphatase THEP1
LNSKKGSLLEADETGKNIVTIGNYKFSKKIFDWAQKELLKAFYLKPEYLIIDEIGFLELKNEGLEPAVSKILKERNSSPTKIILIIRDILLEIALVHYQLSENDYEFFSI